MSDLQCCLFIIHTILSVSGVPVTGGNDGWLSGWFPQSGGSSQQVSEISDRMCELFLSENEKAISGNAGSSSTAEQPIGECRGFFMPLKTVADWSKHQPVKLPNPQVISMGELSERHYRHYCTATPVNFLDSTSAVSIALTTAKCVHILERLQGQTASLYQNYRISNVYGEVRPTDGPLAQEGLLLEDQVGAVLLNWREKFVRQAHENAFPFPSDKNTLKMLNTAKELKNVFVADWGEAEVIEIKAKVVPLNDCFQTTADAQPAHGLLQHAVICVQISTYSSFYTGAPCYRKFHGDYNLLGLYSRPAATRDHHLFVNVNYEYYADQINGMVAELQQKKQEIIRQSKS